MRAPVLGFVARDAAERAAFVDASTRLTHTHPLALEAAQALATAAACARDGIVERAPVLRALAPARRDDVWRPVLALLEVGLGAGLTPGEWAKLAGHDLGVSGFVVHTLPAALFCWLRRPLDVRGAVEDVLRLGGDTDSTAAIVGALAGAAAGARAVPAEWLARIVDWPLSIGWLRRLAPRLAACARGEAVAPLPLRWRVVQPLRNLAFLAVVVVVALRRWAPPY
jgi:ADP-ribosylglycohydrolase